MVAALLLLVGTVPPAPEVAVFPVVEAPLVVAPVGAASVGTAPVVAALVVVGVSGGASVAETP
jgi:hypothetical protein